LLSAELATCEYCGQSRASPAATKAVLALGLLLFTGAAGKTWGRRRARYALTRFGSARM
jgi:hypothetical protein